MSSTEFTRVAIQSIRDGAPNIPPLSPEAQHLNDAINSFGHSFFVGGFLIPMIIIFMIGLVIYTVNAFTSNSLLMSKHRLPYKQTWFTHLKQAVMTIPAIVKNALFYALHHVGKIFIMTTLIVVLLGIVLASIKTQSYAIDILANTWGIFWALAFLQNFWKFSYETKSILVPEPDHYFDLIVSQQRQLQELTHLVTHLAENK